jgi:hypothetical protein
MPARRKWALAKLQQSQRKAYSNLLRANSTKAHCVFDIALALCTTPLTRESERNAKPQLTKPEVPGTTILAHIKTEERHTSGARTALVRALKSKNVKHKWSSGL